jgi:hypothetical protein
LEARTSTLAVALGERLASNMVLGALILLVGCASTPPRTYHNRLHPEYGQTDFDRDYYECSRENSHPAATVAGAYGSAGTVVDGDMARACFRARGWYPD